MLQIGLNLFASCTILHRNFSVLKYWQQGMDHQDAKKFTTGEVSACKWYSSCAYLILIMRTQYTGLGAKSWSSRGVTTKVQGSIMRRFCSILLLPFASSFHAHLLISHHIPLLSHVDCSGANQDRIVAARFLNNKKNKRQPLTVLSSRSCQEFMQTRTNSESLSLIHRGKEGGQQLWAVEILSAPSQSILSGEELRKAISPSSLM